MEDTYKARINGNALLTCLHNTRKGGDVHGNALLDGS